MKPIAAGIFSAFVFSHGLWLIARTCGLNPDPVEAGLVKSTAYTFLIALPIGMVAHAVIEFLRWRIFSMIPVAFGMAVIVAVLLCLFDSSENQLLNILAFLGIPVAYCIPYALILSRKAGKFLSDR